MSKQSFEEWFNEQDYPIDISLLRVGAGFILKREVTPLLEEGAIVAWNHQQKTIDSQEEKIKELESQNKMLRDGTPCDHSGCLSHISHPCEGCGRTGGKTTRKALAQIEEEK